MQRVTNLERQTDQNRKRFDAYENLIADRFNEQYLGDGYLERHGEKLDIYMWEELAGDDEVFEEAFARIITNNKSLKLTIYFTLNPSTTRSTWRFQWK